jgi:hypothetical protein
MNKRKAAEIRGVLSERFPGADIEVSPQDEGAQVVITHPGGVNSGTPVVGFSIGDGPSALLNQLLTGYAT